MKKFLNNRVLPLVCALSILVSLCVVPVSAVWDTDRDVLDIDQVSIWNSKLVQPANMELYVEAFGAGASFTVSDIFWNLVNRVVNGGSVGEVGIDDLESLCVKYNEYFNRPLGDWFGDQILKGSQELASDIIAQAFLGKLSLTFETRSRGTSGMKRIYCPEVDAWVVNSAGQYAYVNEAYLATSGGNHWIPKSSAETNLSKSEVLTGSQMKQVCTMLEVAGEPVYIGNFASKYKAIYRDGREVYANPDGYPFVSAANDAEWAVNQPRPDTSVKDENGNEIEGLPGDNQTNIDLSGMTITLPDGSINFIDKLIYDESTKCYQIDSHDTYNYTVNNYYTFNYYINYTSITYIGQTEEYNKYYEVYYELPDGRDSADLTAEELEQLSLNVDVLPYSRAVDDASLKALYHFDGEIRDASYWNYKTDFKWNKGASLTYMDAGVFEGALYLDENEHDFTFTLPDLIYDDDFTLQFRYYQSHTVAPQTDSYIKIGNTVVLQFDGASLKDADGDSLAAVPVGSWNEICLQRSEGDVYVYLNGVSVGYFSLGSLITSLIHFHFGDDQQTFKYFDELRYCSKALYPVGGASYTPTAVPYDTNLALVLPDSDRIIADEWFTWAGGEKALLSYDFTKGTFPELDICQSTNQTSNKPLSIVQKSSNFNISYEFTENGLVLTRSSGSGAVSDPISGLGLDVSYLENALNPSATGRTQYKIAIYGARGVRLFYKYIVFDKGNFGNFASSLSNAGNVQYAGRNASLGGLYNCIGIYPNSGSMIISRIDIYPVTVTDSDLAYPVVKSTISAMDNEQFHSPSLAVHTDLNITSTQIGGVRPSIPKKGLVWCLVENQRITSIQIYNGQAWEACEGRIWTGERWIPASSYNIITLQDLYDVVDSTPNYEYIYTESGFWSWWQKSWNSFVERLFAALGSGGVGTSGASGGAGSSEMSNVDLDAEDVVSSPDEEDGKTFWQFIVLVINGGKSVVGGVRHLFSGVVSSVPQSMEIISGSFDSGGIAVGIFDGSSSDPDAAESPAMYSDEESEVLDPWRYR